MEKKRKASFFRLQPKLFLTIVFVLIIGFLGGIRYSRYFPSPPVKQELKFPSQATISRVIDGDTFEIASGQTVRLYGISCPERGKPFYDQAKEFTESQILNQQIFLEYEEKYQSDKFGRLLAYAFVNGKNLNIELVRQGLCKVVIYEKRAKLIYQDKLLDVQEKAKKEKLGVWGK